MFNAVASASPATVPYTPTREWLIVPEASLLPVSIPAAGPLLTKSTVVRGITIDAKSTAFAPQAWFVSKNLKPIVTASNAPVKFTLSFLFSIFCFSWGIIG